jgi:hypothetical protein
MAEAIVNAEARRKLLRELLLNYLQFARLPAWPGSDGQTVEEVLLEYPDAAAAGLVPNREQLLQAHPDLADEVNAFIPGRNSLGGHPG